MRPVDSPRLLILGCALLILLAGCSANEAPPVPSRTVRALTLLPADARVAGMVDLQDLQQNGGITFSGARGVTIRFMDSDVTLNPLSSAQQRRVRAFLDATGFEPGMDLHAVYVTADSLGAQAALIAADIDRDRLLAQLETNFGEAVDTSTYRAAQVVTLELPGNEDELQFALLDEGWIVLTPQRTTLRAIIDRSVDTEATAQTQAVQPLVQQVAGRGGVWGVVRDQPSQYFVPADESQRITQIAAAVRDVAVALNVEGENTNGTVLLTTDQNAGDLASVVRGLVSTAKMREDLSEEQRALLDRVTVTDRQGEVWVDFAIDEATLAQLLIQAMQSSDRMISMR